MTSRVESADARIKEQDKMLSDKIVGDGGDGIMCRNCCAMKEPLV